MESLRRLFCKLRSKDKNKSSKKEFTSNGREVSKATSEEAPSNATKQKVAAAKQYIEKHYKEQMKSLEERKERYDFRYINSRQLFISDVGSIYLFMFLEAPIWISSC